MEEEGGGPPGVEHPLVQHKGDALVSVVDAAERGDRALLELEVCHQHLEGADGMEGGIGDNADIGNWVIEN